MAQKYTAGEVKIRPGVYYRYSTDSVPTAGALDGVNAIIMKASWGPVGTVTIHESAQSIVDAYGKGDGVNCALMLKAAGARRVLVYRCEGTGGKAATGNVGDLTVTAKYVGARALKVKVQEKPADSTVKQFIVIEGTTQVEKFEFAAGTGEGAAIVEATAKSAYVTVTGTATTISAQEVELTGGADPTVTAEDYMKGLTALESYRYNVVSTDSVDAGVASIVQNYVAEAENNGKMIMGVLGAAPDAELADKLSAAKACNSKGIIYVGNGFITADDETVEGAEAVNYAAGVISSTPANQSIVHSVVSGAVDVTERLTFAQYESAILNGLLLFSAGPDGQVWFDSGINTLTTLSAEEDAGWKKIKRTKIRYELLDRVDRVVAPLIGKVNCNADGIAAVIQAGMGVIADMVAEGKILSSTTIILDPDKQYEGDSAWFLIECYDVDALEKVYLHYKFSYTQSV